MGKVLQFSPAKSVSKREALEQFNSTNLWFFVEINQLKIDPGPCPSMAIYIPKNAVVPTWFNKENFGRVYLE